MDLFYTIRRNLAPVHPQGYPFVAAFLAVTLVLFFIFPPLGWIGVMLTLWCASFFRDPLRVTPLEPGLVISPADGIVSHVGLRVPPAELGLGTAPRWRVGTFLSVMDVHVNRVPADGTVTRIAYRHGAFVNASLDKASEDNERNAIALALPDGRDLAVVQIAGLIARRILCDVREGEVVRAGERFGIIRFGSRTDLYLPEGVRPLVAEGQTMIGGETVIADLGAGGQSPKAQA
jgi:phosphatidylserine decarboxylase